MALGRIALKKVHVPCPLIPSVRAHQCLSSRHKFHDVGVQSVKTTNYLDSVKTATQTVTVTREHGFQDERNWTP